MDSIVNTPYWPFIVLLVGIASVVITITKFKFHPFIALIVSAVLVGLISSPMEGMEQKNHLLNALELPMVEFGNLAGKIAIVIVLAAIIGTAMMESGAAAKIVDSLVKGLGERNGAAALLISGFILSIPVFFDTVFFLLIPVVIALAIKTKKDYLLYIMAAGVGGAITHSIVPPTPGPLVMAEIFGVNLGLTILVGIMVGVIPSIAALIVAKKINAKMEIPVRVAYGSSIESDRLPSLFAALLPIVIPIILISTVSFLDVMEIKAPDLVAFMGDKNIAMAIGTLFAVTLWVRRQNLDKQSLWKEIAKPLEIAGVIILITGAGGAFGAMIKHSGIGEAIKLTLEDFHVHYVLLAWLISSAMKTAQGSGTVAIITTAGIMYAIIGTGADLPYHPVYVLMAIGFGGIFIEWMNDSGFWVVAKMSGLTEQETLKSFSVVLAVASIVGITQLILLSYLIPLK